MASIFAEIRAATPSDAAAIARLKHLVWPEAAVRPEQIARVLASEEHVISVAVVDQAVVGFVSSFPTVSTNGVRRWEVDLLAVDPAYRKQGIARRLVEATTAVGRQNDLAFARALIEENNVASARAFKGCNYRQGATLQHLYISQRQVVAGTALPAQTHLIPVQTVAYRGYWIEGTVEVQGLLAAQAIRARNAADLVGLVLPDGWSAERATALASGFTRVGGYYWWRYNFST